MPPQISLEFRVFLVNAATGSHTQEARTLGFWFKPGGPGAARSAQDFFRDLVTPQDFPRDYVGFITKLMKLLQHGHPCITRLEVVLEQLKPAQLPERPCKYLPMNLFLFSLAKAPHTLYDGWQAVASRGDCCWNLS